MPDRGPDPARLAELGDELVALGKALDELPPRFAVYLVERFYLGDGYQDIAERHGEFDPVAARDLVLAALRAIRKRLGIPPPGRGRQRMSIASLADYRRARREAKRQAARDLRRAGLSRREIADRLGTSSSFAFTTTREVVAT